MGLSLSSTFRKYRVYGITLRSNLPLDPWLPFSDEPASLTVEGCQVDEELPVPSSIATGRIKQLGVSHLFFYRLGKSLYLNMPRMGAFLIAQDEILVQFHPEANLVMVCATLLSTGLSLWLEQHKTRAIHASCLLYRGKAAAFMADSTTGKSTLAAALLWAGAELLSDDIVPITETPNGFFASPGYPAIRLSQEQAGHFLGRRANLACWYPELGKALIPIGKNGWGSFCDLPQKIQRLYILNRIPSEPGGEVQFEPLSDAHSVLSLIRFSFIIRNTSETGMTVERMPFFARLVTQVGVTRLTYPSGYEHLAEVTRRIFQDMDNSENI